MDQFTTQFTTILKESIHRSEEMCKAQLFLQNEAAYACIAELGELGLVQFKDLNENVNAFQRKFVKEVRRCDEMERKLRFLEREIKKDGIPMLDTGENPEAPQPKEMFDLEATFEKLENELREVNSNEEMLKKNFVELTELKHILRKTQQFFDENEGERQALSSLAYDEISSGDVSVLIPSTERVEQQTAKGHLKFLTGVIQRERLPAFERLLWRACRGNVFLRQSEITESLIDSTTDLPVQKSVFIIFFQGEQLKNRIKKICEGFRATIYPCPDKPQERREMSIGVMTRIEDLKTVLGQTQDHKHRVLVAAAKNVRIWMTKICKIKAIYHTLNLFNVDVTQKCLIAECWCPISELDRIQLALKRGSDESGSTVPSILQRMDAPSEQPPTYNKTNKYTRSFQNLVDSYGVASYREINPAPYTMITFPFLFAIMFGDLGHGAIMLAFALYFIRNEKRLEAARITDEIFQMFFSGRYLIFLMGAFSIYTGFIYNDAFSKSFNLFGSSWLNYYPEANLTEFLQKNNEDVTLIPERAFSSGGPYPLGIDPVWNVAEANKLNFLNSLKMKSSVIIGISQMTLGVVLSYYNYKHQNSRLDILYTFIPQMIFLSCIFIYLCLQIIAKWILYGAKGGRILGYYYPGSHCAPSLLIGLINMFMLKDRPKGFVHDYDDKDGPAEIDNCHLTYWYPGQVCKKDISIFAFNMAFSFFESLFIPVAIGCVFVMLFAKPYLLWQANKQRQQTTGRSQLDIAEHILIALALISVPVMLFIKPLFIYRQHQKAIVCRNDTFSELNFDPENSIRGGVHVDQDSNSFGGGVSNMIVRADMAQDGDVEVLHNNEPQEIKIDSASQEFNFGDIMVYQAIHTIEFALGCISHTASYLRLWALSLAHGQLSEVLWTMVFRQAMMLDGYLGAISTFIIFGIFATLTLFILVLMEGLSAFLHALRLHWVEFQSKFYAGTGYPFLPFSFDIILEQMRSLEETSQ